MIKMQAYDPINFWIIIEEGDALYLLKPPYRSIEDKIFITKDKLEEAVCKRGFLPEIQSFDYIEDALSFIKIKKTQIDSEFSSKEADEFYAFIPERPLMNFFDRYQPKIPALSADKLENLRNIAELILHKNPHIIKNGELKKKYSLLKEACSKQLISLSENKARKFNDLSRNQDIYELWSSVSQFLSGNKRLLSFP